MIFFKKLNFIFLCLFLSLFLDYKSVNAEELPIYNEILSRYSTTKPLKGARICLTYHKGKKRGQELVSTLTDFGAKVIVFSPTKNIDPYGLFTYDLQFSQNNLTPITFNENTIKTLEEFKPNFLIDTSGSGILFEYILNSDSKLMEKMSLDLLYNTDLKKQVNKLEENNKSFPPIVDYFLSVLITMFVLPDL